MRKRSKYRRLLATLIATLTVVAGSILAATSTASAATTRTSAPASKSTHMVKKTLPMHRTHAVKIISTDPNKKGQVKVQLSDGHIVPMAQNIAQKALSPAAQKAATRAAAADTGCGTAWVEIGPKPDNAPLQMTTGFTVPDTLEPAIYYNWFVWMNNSDESWTDTYTSSGPLALADSWSGTYDSAEDLGGDTYNATIGELADEAYYELDDLTQCVVDGSVSGYIPPAQAACLDDIPTDATLSGTGWILNTSVPIADTNQITSPPTAGNRPDLATACLSSTLGTGTDASGSPTGWLDAQNFATNNGYDPSSALARCHLIAQAVGGRGILLNEVPCWQVGTNTGTPSMRTYESQVQAAQAAMGPNDAIYYQVLPVYWNSNSTIPYDIDMTAVHQYANGTSAVLFDVTIPNDSTTGLNLGN